MEESVGENVQDTSDTFHQRGENIFQQINIIAKKPRKIITVFNGKPRKGQTGIVNDFLCSGIETILCPHDAIRKIGIFFEISEKNLLNIDQFAQYTEITH